MSLDFVLFSGIRTVKDYRDLEVRLNTFGIMRWL